MAKPSVTVQVPQETYDRLVKIAGQYDVPIGQAIQILETQYQRKLEKQREQAFQGLKERIKKLEKKLGEVKETKKGAEPVTFKCPYCFKEFDTFKKLSAHVRATQDTEHGGKGYPEDWESRKRAIKSELEVEEKAQPDMSEQIHEAIQSIKV